MSWSVPPTSAATASDALQNNVILSAPSWPEVLILNALLAFAAMIISNHCPVSVPINGSIRVTALVGVIFVNFISLPIYISIAGAVGMGIFLMIILDVVHPPAGGNPIMVIIGSASFEYLINPIIFGCIIILLLAILINKYLLQKNYPLK